ncbi:nuclear protein 1 isoform X1 [Chelonia mydas]|uniref:nuclear protein 1 isoform X1 n=1 Tax=Chelonia mydas TaxID=8469 RepID=UPI001CA89217|nr:nuclear protein 1 isoform X1 [Chelonia mydas]
MAGALLEPHKLIPTPFEGQHFDPYDYYSLTERYSNAPQEWQPSSPGAPTASAPLPERASAMVSAQSSGPLPCKCRAGAAGRAAPSGRPLGTRTGPTPPATSARSP